MQDCQDLEGSYVSNVNLRINQKSLQDLEYSWQDFFTWASVISKVYTHRELTKQQRQKQQHKSHSAPY